MNTHAIELISVVIPARNEALLIGRCLDAVVASRTHLRGVLAPGQCPRVVILVVLDACTDETSSEVKARNATALRTSEGNVGAARSAGVDYALDTGGTADGRHWIANTDADSTVPRHWLATQLMLAEGGADVVTGLVTVEAEELSTTQHERWIAAHPIRTDHEYVYGANLGIRADCYRRAGGFPPQPTSEDQALIDRARQLGANVVATTDASVSTSGRRGARAPGGLSHWLHTPNSPAE